MIETHKICAGPRTGYTREGGIWNPIILVFGKSDRGRDPGAARIFAGSGGPNCCGTKLERLRVGGV